MSTRQNFFKLVRIIGGKMFLQNPCFKHFVWVLILASIFCPGGKKSSFCSSALAGIQEDGARYLITTKSFSLALDKKDGSFQMKNGFSDSVLKEAVGSVFLFEKKEKKDLNGGTFSDFKIKDGSLSFKYLDKNLSLKTGQTITIYPDYITWTIAPEMAGNNPLFLEIGIRLALSFKDNRYTYWDGNKAIESPAAYHLRNKSVGTFPMACVYSEKSGVAVGNAALEPLNYLENSITPSRDGPSVFYYGTRLVADGKIKDSVTFVLYNFESEYGGFKSALQRYYDIYPEAFSPRKDINPKIKLGSIGNAVWASGRTDVPPGTLPTSLEYARRLYGAWSWGMCPYKRGGDIYGWKELWDYTPALPWSHSELLSWDEFHKFRTERFALLDGEIAGGFYVQIMWCEQQLVNERFKDARVTPEMDPETRTVENKPYCTSDHDLGFKVLAYRTSYERFFKESMKKLAQEVDLYAWNFDIPQDIGKYRGTELDKCRGRAFDDLGAYVDVSMGVAEMMDYAHTLNNQNGKYKTGVVGNFDQGLFPASFRTDAVIFEGPPYPYLEYIKSVRYFSGRKSISWWNDYNLDPYIDWESMSPVDIKEAFLVARDNVLLSSFYLGGIPFFTYLRGVPRLLEYMPALLDTVTTGWEPLVPVKASRGLWLSRYGKGIKTILCLGNAKDQPVNTDIRVENRFLGDLSYAFTTHTGEKTLQDIDGGYTVVPTTIIPRRTPLILRAQLGFRPGGNVKVSVFQTNTQYESIVQTTLKTAKAFTTPVVARLETDKKVFSLSVNGKEIKDLQEKEGGVLFKADLVPGENKVIVIQRSTMLLNPDDEILAFPALKKYKQPNCSIVYAEGDQEARRLSLRIQEYFRFYGASLTPSFQIDIPIKTDQEFQSGENMIIVDTGQKNGLSKKLGIGFEGESAVMVKKDGQFQAIYIGGTDHSTTQDAALLLFRLWDKEYKYYGTFPELSYVYNYQRPDGSFAAKKAGLVGKLLE